MSSRAFRQGHTARKVIAPETPLAPPPDIAYEDPNFGPPTSRPMIQPPRSSAFTRAPGYTGPVPPGSPGDYMNYVPSNRLSGPSLTIPGGRPGISTGGYRSSFNTGGAIQGGIQGAQSPGDAPWWVKAGIGVLTGGLGGSTGSGSNSGQTSSAALSSEGTGSCPSGYERDSTGNCVKSGFGGAVERFVPGGQTGTLADQYGEAVVGSFGIPAIVPMQTGTVRKRDGTVNPTLGCPPGAVLGKDNLCYMKGSIPRQFRKWKPKPRPVMSAADGKTLRKADRLRTKVKKLATSSGFSCRKR